MLSLSSSLRTSRRVFPCLIRSIHSGPVLSSPVNNDGNDHIVVSDHEWDIRTGVSHGITSCTSESHLIIGTRLQGRAIYTLQQTLPSFFQTGLVANVNATGVPAKHTDDENIYSPQIRLVYTPPVALPSPFPRTLSIEGKI